MCGPLVMLLAKNPCRWWYFFGRLCAFTLAGVLSAEMGLFFFSFLSRYHISALFSLVFGIWIFGMGIFIFLNVRLPAFSWLAKTSATLSTFFARRFFKASPLSIFLFGMTTVIFPCGQTLVVFSILALHCKPLEGLIQGCLFALLTSPALIAAMHTAQLFASLKKGYHFWMGSAVVAVGTLAILRGMADLQLIKHFILNPSAPPHSHIVLF
jgi:sulfite exporter TauE/SafE